MVQRSIYSYYDRHEQQAQPYRSGNVMSRARLVQSLQPTPFSDDAEQQMHPIQITNNQAPPSPLRCEIRGHDSPASEFPTELPLCFPEESPGQCCSSAHTPPNESENMVMGRGHRRQFEPSFPHTVEEDRPLQEMEHRNGFLRSAEAPRTIFGDQRAFVSDITMEGFLCPSVIENAVESAGPIESNCQPPEEIDHSSLSSPPVGLKRSSIVKRINVAPEGTVCSLNINDEVVPPARITRPEPERLGSDSQPISRTASIDSKKMEEKPPSTGQSADQSDILPPMPSLRKVNAPEFIVPARRFHPRRSSRTFRNNPIGPPLTIDDDDNTVVSEITMDDFSHVQSRPSKSVRAPADDFQIVAQITSLKTAQGDADRMLADMFPDGPQFVSNVTLNETKAARIRSIVAPTRRSKPFNPHVLEQDLPSTSQSTSASTPSGASRHTPARNAKPFNPHTPDLASTSQSAESLSRNSEGNTPLPYSIRHSESRTSGLHDFHIPDLTSPSPSNTVEIPAKSSKCFSRCDPNNSRIPELSSTSNSSSSESSQSEATPARAPPQINTLPSSLPLIPESNGSRMATLESVTSDVDLDADVDVDVVDPVKVTMVLEVVPTATEDRCRQLLRTNSINTTLMMLLSEMKLEDDAEYSI